MYTKLVFPMNKLRNLARLSKTIRNVMVSMQVAGFSKPFHWKYKMCIQHVALSLGKLTFPCVLCFSNFLPSLRSCQSTNISMVLLHILQIKFPMLSEIVIQDHPVNKLNPIAKEITKNTNSKI